MYIASIRWNDSINFVFYKQRAIYDRVVDLPLKCRFQFSIVNIPDIESCIWFEFSTRFESVFKRNTLCSSMIQRIFCYFSVQKNGTLAIT